MPTSRVKTKLFLTFEIAIILQNVGYPLIQPHTVIFKKKSKKKKMQVGKKGTFWQIKHF